MCIRDRLETLKEEKIAELKEEGFAITNFHSGGVFYTLLLIVPVSYTHLDVYKRQAYGRSHIKRQRNRLKAAKGKCSARQYLSLIHISAFA